MFRPFQRGFEIGTTGLGENWQAVPGKPEWQGGRFEDVVGRLLFHVPDLGHLNR